MENSFILVPEPPFDTYVRGRVYLSKRDNRRCIHLSSPGHRTLDTTYARYLFQVDYWSKYFNLIPDDYEVDHINEDKLDDRLENLQLLTYQDNIRKNNYVRGSLYHVYCCPMCGSLFTKLGYHAIENRVFLCSHECLSAFGMSWPNAEIRSYLKDHQIKYVIKIYKNFPSGEERFFEIVESNKNSFYPNCLYKGKDLLPQHLRSDLNVVNYHQRVSDVRELKLKGYAQRKIAEQLGITRSAVETALKYI